MTEYQKFLLNNAALSAGMLGEFSLEQKYILPKSITDELIKLTKLITQFRENEIRCYAKVGENTFNFVINIFVVNLRIQNIFAKKALEGPAMRKK